MPLTCVALTTPVNEFGSGDNDVAARNREEYTVSDTICPVEVSVHEIRRGSMERDTRRK